MRFRLLRRNRRKPKPPFLLLELDLPFDEVMADLVAPVHASGDGQAVKSRSGTNRGGVGLSARRGRRERIQVRPDILDYQDSSLPGLPGP